MKTVSEAYKGQVSDTVKACATGLTRIADPLPKLVYGRSEGESIQSRNFGP